MIKAKDLHQYSQELQLLYVEDDEKLLKETASLFEPFFKSVETAQDGAAGLEKYNNAFYDIVITDINMPRMNGIEMITQIRQINPEQKVLAISAHNEPDILIDLIKAGVNGFVLKPIIQQEIINSLYPVCRDAYMQQLNIALVHQLNDEKAKLEKQNRELKAQSNTIDAKHRQIGILMQKVQNPQERPEPIGQEYFAADEDEGEENVVFLHDHSEDLLDIFNEIPELISHYMMGNNKADIEKIVNHLGKASTILFHYSPYLDNISSSMNELSTCIHDNMETFLHLLENDPDSLLVLFDAVSSDMERYAHKFKTQSLAMKNTHHLHEPTALSIQQIIAIISPAEVEYGDFEFF